jgi:hypothetical protein
MSDHAPTPETSPASPLPPPPLPPPPPGWQDDQWQQYQHHQYQQQQYWQQQYRQPDGGPAGPQPWQRSTMGAEPTWFERGFSDGVAWFRRHSPTAEPSRWLAGVGATLLLVAGIAVTVANWQSVSPVLRLAALMVFQLLIVAMAEALRRRLPDVATALCHLGAALFAATGIQAVSTVGRQIDWSPIGGRWPVCCVVGGVLAWVGLEVQRRRWSSSSMQAEQVLAVVLAGAGLAAWSGVPGGVIAGVAALASFGVSRVRSATVLGLVALGAPVALAGSSDVSWGNGTIGRILGDSHLSWGAPLAGFLGALALFAIAARRNSADPHHGRLLLWTAALGLTLNATVGYVSADLPWRFDILGWMVWVPLILWAFVKQDEVAGILAAIAAPAQLAVQLFYIHDTTALMFTTGFVLIAVMCLALLALSTSRPVLRNPAIVGAYTASAFILFSAVGYTELTASRVAGLSVIAAGVTTVLVGRVTGRKALSTVGAVVVAIGTVIELVSVSSINGFDVIFVVCVIAATLTEWAGRKSGRLQSAHAYALPASLGAAYALLGQLMYSGQWIRAVIALTVGLFLITVGTLTGRNAVAYIGIGTLAATIIGQFGPRLAAMPLWAQLFAGGATLVGLAVVVERRRSATTSKTQ